MKISIITVVYNNEKYIEQCIQSVINQTYKNIEYIVVDGNSSDGTLEIIKKYGNQIDVLLSEKDNGIYDALNKGLQLATGDVVGILHSDDIYNSTDIIEKIANEFINKDINALHGDLIYVQKDDPDKIVRNWESSPFKFNNLKNGWMPPHPTLFLKKEVTEVVQNYQLQYKIAADYDFMLRVFNIPQIKSFYTPIVITRMRNGGTSNKNLINIFKKSYEDYLILKRNKVGGLQSLFFKNFNKLSQFFLKVK